MRDYENEAFLAWYRKPTVGWLELSMAARGLLVSIAMELNPKTGELYLRKGLPSLAILLRCSWEEIETPIGELVAAGKLAWDGAKFLLRDPDHEERRRRTTADRVRDHRAREKAKTDPPPPVTDVTPVTLQALQEGDVTDVTVPLFSSLLFSSSDQEGEPEREGPELKPSTLRYREAYAAGIAKVKGSPYAWPPGPKSDEWADKDLGHAIATFAKSRSSGEALRGEKLLAWIAGAAEDFARHVITAGDDPKFWSAFAPKGLVRFLSAEVRSEEARRVG